MPDIGLAWWIAPDEVYDVPKTHWAWMMSHKQLLNDKYGITDDLLKQNDFGGAENIECSLLVDRGWIQLRLNKGQLNVIMKSDSQISWLRSYLLDKDYPFKFISIDTNDNVEIYNKNYFYDKYKNENIEKVAGRRNQSNNDNNEAWWLTPDNKVFEVPSDLSHWGWMQNNKDMLKQQYGIDTERAEVWDFIAKGWIRVHRFNNQLVIDYNGQSNLTRVVNLIYDNDIIKNVNGILNIRNVSVQNSNGQTNILDTKTFLRKYSKLNNILNIKKQIINEFL